MYVYLNKTGLVFCAVSPTCEHYGHEYPIWMFHNDGSWSRQYRTAYQRSVANKLKKPFMEYTVTELNDIIQGGEVS